MSLIICKGPLCQTTAGCICEHQLRPQRIVLEMDTRPLPELLLEEAKKHVNGPYYTPTGSTLAAAADEIDRLTRERDEARRERDGERDAREKSDRALRGKDEAMGELFRRLQAAGLDVSDLVS